MDGKIYIAFNNSIDIYSISPDGTGGAVFTTGYHNPWGVATDGTSLYVAHQYDGTVDGRAVRIEANETLKWAAPVIRASGIATLGDYVYVTSNSMDLVYRVLKNSSGTGTSELVAGDGYAVRESTDNIIGSSASFWAPAGICSDGNYLYVIDCGSQIIRKIDPATTEVTTFAGSGTAAITDSVGTAASFFSLNHIASDGTYLNGQMPIRSAASISDSASRNHVHDPLRRERTDQGRRRHLRSCR